MLPLTRDDFKNYVLRKLGAPVINIDVADEQVEDRIDDALNFWTDYHFRGTEKVYMSHQIVQEDFTNRYVVLDANIKSITRMISLNTSLGSSSLFSLNYQFAQSDLLQTALSAGSMIPLWMSLTNLEFVQQILIGGQPIRFNIYSNRVYVDMDWTRCAVGDWIVFEGYKAITPTEFPQVWQDKWLLEYTTALVKRQWGGNVKKYGNMQMPGGTTFNGQAIFDEAEQDIRRLEDDMHSKYSAPIEFLVG